MRSSYSQRGRGRAGNAGCDRSSSHKSQPSTRARASYKRSGLLCSCPELDLELRKVICASPARFLAMSYLRDVVSWRYCRVYAKLFCFGELNTTDGGKPWTTCSVAPGSPTSDMRPSGS